MKLIAFLSLFMFSSVLANLTISFSSLSTKYASVQNEIIDTHNLYRRNTDPSARNMLKMEWSKEAQSIAELWAKECTMSHSPPENRFISSYSCGENIFYSTAPKSWKTVIDFLGDEKEYFEYGIGAKSDKIIGHYTQMVWYKSFLIGCAVTQCNYTNYSVFFYVCEYCPAGNINSLAYPYKAGPPCDDCKDFCSDGLCTNPCPYEDFYYGCAQYKIFCQDPYIFNYCTATCSCESEIV
ncbi:cysteine-rich venom protein-like [Pyxicephalus adspersus]|uniref:ShKT domain-containing protein n=1 Tax=Pyxicephalus adspersus TaxID=30357 RepID=A0AAV3ASM5_PYXAD|nr:TPA: hypothetical protein GDO54_010036 [Pyxicephalus adspersus]